MLVDFSFPKGEAAAYVSFCTDKRDSKAKNDEVF
jgi:hypothetical protein